MKELPKYYTVLFNAMSEAVESIDAQNYGTAKRILMRGQYEAEALYVAETEMEEWKKGQEKPKE